MSLILLSPTVPRLSECLPWGTQHLSPLTKANSAESHPSTACLASKIACTPVPWSHSTGRLILELANPCMHRAIASHLKPIRGTRHTPTTKRRTHHARAPEITRSSKSLPSAFQAVKVSTAKSNCAHTKIVTVFYGVRSLQLLQLLQEC